MQNFGEKRWRSDVIDDIRSQTDQITPIFGDSRCVALDPESSELADTGFSLEQSDRGSFFPDATHRKKSSTYTSTHHASIYVHVQESLGDIYKTLLASMYRLLNAPDSSGHNIESIPSTVSLPNRDGRNAFPLSCSISLRTPVLFKLPLLFLQHHQSLPRPRSSSSMTSTCCALTGNTLRCEIQDCQTGIGLSLLGDSEESHCLSCFMSAFLALVSSTLEIPDVGVRNYLRLVSPRPMEEAQNLNLGEAAAFAHLDVDTPRQGPQATGEHSGSLRFE